MERPVLGAFLCAVGLVWMAASLFVWVIAARGGYVTTGVVGGSLLRLVLGVYLWRHGRATRRGDRPRVRKAAALSIGALVLGLVGMLLVGAHPSAGLGNDAFYSREPNIFAPEVGIVHVAGYDAGLRTEDLLPLMGLAALAFLLSLPPLFARNPSTPAPEPAPPPDPTLA